MIKSILLKIKQIRGALHELLKSTRRSSRWNAVRDAYLKEHTKCVACGSTVKLQVHHIKPFRIEPALELDTKNLITLCMSKFVKILVAYFPDIDCLNAGLPITWCLPSIS